MKILTDQMLYRMEEWIAEIENESTRQFLKWGIQKRTAFEWLAYLTEEVGEVAEAISEHEYRDGTRDRVTKEAIHVATLALKIAEMYAEDKFWQP